MALKELKSFESSEQSYQRLRHDSDMTQSQIVTTVENISSCSKVKNALFRCGAHFQSLKIEVVAFLVMLSSTMTAITSTNLIMDKACLVHFEHPQNICSNLNNDNYSDIRTDVVKFSTNYQLCHSLIETLPAAILANFIGPWSDHYGRRVPIIFALLGMLLDSAGSIVCAYILFSRIEYYFIPAIFSGICGGKVTIMAVVMSYASDVTPVESRTLKYAFLGLYTSLGITAGSAAGGWIFDFFSYPAVYISSVVGFILTVLWVVFKLPETRGIENTDMWSTKLKNLYSCETLRQSWIAITKDRPHRGKIQVQMLIISVTCIVIGVNSSGDIDYLFVHLQFDWNNAKFSTVSAVYTIIGIPMYVLVLSLLKCFNGGYPALGLIGTTSILMKNAALSVAYKTQIYHLACLAGLLSGSAIIACQSGISKLVSNEDLGKIFSFVSIAQSLTPILASVMLSQIFRNCLDFFPGMPYAVVAVFLILPLIVFIWMIRLPKITVNENVANHSEENNTSIEAK